MNHRQWKKNYKKQYGYNPPAYMDKRKRRKARAQQSLPCAGISVEQITQAMATFTEAVFTVAGNMCNALAQAFSRQAQAFNAVADQYKDDKAEVSELQKGNEPQVVIQQVPQAGEQNPQPEAGETQDGQTEKEGVNNAS